MERVWGTRPAEAELEWFYERNPVRPASVLLGEEDGKVVATVAIAFVRMSIGGEAIEVGMPLRVATDPAYQGRGIFRELAGRERGAGARARRSGCCSPCRTPPRRPCSSNGSAGRRCRRSASGRGARLRLRTPRPRRRSTGSAPAIVAPPGGPDRVLRDAAWLNWRFADAPTPYTLLEGGGLRGRRAAADASASSRPSRASCSGRPASRPAGPARSPRRRRGSARRYSLAGYVPTHEVLHRARQVAPPRAAGPGRGRTSSSATSTSSEPSVRLAA